MGGGLASWHDVVSSDKARINENRRLELEAVLAACGPLGHDVVNIADQILSSAPFKRILDLCPCLYAQLNVRVTARGVVHLCEITLGERIDSTNVFNAFQIQHPGIENIPFVFPPIQAGAGGGDIMEALCSEVLSNHGVPHMALDQDGWPKWVGASHLSLNAGKMQALKLYGDLLVPAAPHNILVSVKSEAARERFVVSGNRLESVGFGFFNNASEFWTTSRMNLLKRWGFTAIYMPDNTYQAIRNHLDERGTSNHAININGRPLFRRLEDFGPDIARVAGKLSMDI